MRWRWICKNETREAVRAVDTATHPDYQGKGVFSNLTRALLKQCEDEGWDFVYNTPNSKSMPGYLKMGWEIAGKLPIDFRIVRPFHMALSVVSKSSSDANSDPDDKSLLFYLTHRDLEKLLLQQRANAHDFISAHTIKSLQWRYVDVPVAKYYAAGIEENGLKCFFVYRLKATRFGRELRVTDVVLESPDQIKKLRHVVGDKIRQHQADYVTSAGFLNQGLIRGFFSISQKQIGPMVTIRKISQHGLNDLTMFKRWHPSMGDLELF